MSVSQEISPYIPYLRRFARALTGTQGSGDAYVLATLEAILAEPTSLAPDGDYRVGLYRLFLKVWSSVPANRAVEAMESTDIAAATRNLNAIALRPRIAFLLSALEDFQIEEIARALDCSEQDAQALIVQAGREIADQIRSDVVIIEDEPLIALDLKTLVEDLGHRVVAVARTHKQAVVAAKNHSPGLILADIQLADGSSGLDAVNEILQAFEVPVIFITAYPERLLQGQAPEPAFLISKPFVVDAVKAVISQALFFDHKSRPLEKKAAAG
jgi:CheY-like chemotaxis protein